MESALSAFDGERRGQAHLTSSLTALPGISGPYGFPVAGFVVVLEIVPYGDPITFAQKMKNRVGSKALFGPSSGPHLPSASSLLLIYDAPILDIGRPSQRMTDDQTVILGSVELAPCFESDWDVGDLDA